MTTRTDIHRPSAFVPGEYTPVLSYSLATTNDSYPVPPIGINCEVDRRQTDTEGRVICNGSHNPDGHCCVLGLTTVAKVKFAGTGSVGKCSICGAQFLYGDVWCHKPTGEHIHIGHNCVDKYSMLIDRSAWELENNRVRQAAATALIRHKNAQERQEFLDAHQGLKEALKANHNIIQSIAQNFKQYRKLSDKQIALVFKIAHEVANPAPAETYVPAPEGKVTVRGEIVSTKSYETAYGNTLKMTVKVKTSEGVWLAWGSVPQSLLGNEPVKGKTVEFTATLIRGRDAHFALFKRPTKAQFVEPLFK